MEYVEYLQSKGFSSSSILSYQSVSNRFERWIEAQGISISEITYNDATAYIQYLKSKNHTQRTIQLEVGRLKHYFSYQKNVGNLSYIPINKIKIQGVKRQKLYEILKQEELDYIYQSYPPKTLEALTPIQRRNKILLSLFIYQGINTTDLGNLKLEHIDFRNGKITIPPTKKSNGRTLKLEAHQAIELQQYIEKDREELLKTKKYSKEENLREVDDLIFSQGTGSKIGNLLFGFVKELKAQHPELESIKQIRTSVITHWLKQYNLREVQYRAGHRFVSSTESYRINDIETLKNDINQYSPTLR